MRWFVTAAAVTVFGTGQVAAQLKPDTAGIATQAIEVNARPIATFARNGKLFENARLEWRGGLVLTSPANEFGGWSGLTVSPNGKTFVAVSDSGVWMTGDIAYEGTRPSAIKSARLGALQTANGNPLTRARDRDAEAITLAGGTLKKGTAYIAFEQNDRIGVFNLDKNGLGKPASYMSMPKEAARMRLDGIEALAVLTGGQHKGSLVAFAENPLPGEKVHRGWIWTSGTPRGFAIADIGRFSITDAAGLPDGSLLILERFFRWTEGLKIRLRHLTADGIKPGGIAKGEVLLEADTSYEIDNLEALAVSQGERGETVITLMSDDNFNRFLQRTVFLQFTLKERTTAQAGSKSGAKN